MWRALMCLASKLDDGKTSSVTNVTVHVLQPPLSRSGRKIFRASRHEPKEKKPPTANAGHLRAVPAGQLVRLYGAAEKAIITARLTTRGNFPPSPRASAPG